MFIGIYKHIDDHLSSFIKILYMTYFVYVISLFIVYIIVEQSFTNKLRLNLAIKHKK